MDAAGGVWSFPSPELLLSNGAINQRCSKAPLCQDDRRFPKLRKTNEACNARQECAEIEGVIASNGGIKLAQEDLGINIFAYRLPGHVLRILAVVSMQDP